MYKKVPPLRALRAFEASARRLSFTKAAEELYVTQAAVSLQVKQLEELLGVLLFRRGSRSLKLTGEGQAFLQEVREALDLLAAATDRLSRRNRSEQLSISVLPSFASKWVVPRLRKFHRQHPAANIRIAAFDWLVDFEKDNIDVAIRFGNGDWAGTRTYLLMREEVFPVCSPELEQADRPLAAPSDLTHHTLLHDDYSREDWKMWFLAAGVDDISPDKGLSFSHTSLMLEAAASGAGIALGRSPLVQYDLDRGRLVRPFDTAIPSEYAYYVVLPENRPASSVAEDFVDWLLQEAAG